MTHPAQSRANATGVHLSVLAPTQAHLLPMDEIPDSVFSDPGTTVLYPDDVAVRTVVSAPARTVCAGRDLSCAIIMLRVITLGKLTRPAPLSHLARWALRTWPGLTFPSQMSSSWTPWCEAPRLTALCAFIRLPRGCEAVTPRFSHLLSPGAAAVATRQGDHE